MECTEKLRVLLSPRVSFSFR